MVAERWLRQHEIYETLASFLNLHEEPPVEDTPVPQQDECSDKPEAPLSAALRSIDESRRRAQGSPLS